VTLPHESDEGRLVEAWEREYRRRLSRFAVTPGFGLAHHPVPVDFRAGWNARDAEFSVLQERIRAAREVISLLTSELSGHMGYIKGLHQPPYGTPQSAIERAHEVLDALTPTKKGDEM